jgi:hypothetical protein
VTPQPTGVKQLMSLNIFLRKHGLTARGGAVKRILENNKVNNKARRILNSGKEGGGFGGMGAGYIKNLSNDQWKSILENLNKTHMTPNQRRIFRNAANMRSNHRVNSWTAKRLRSAGGLAVKAGAAVGGAALLARETLPNSAKQRIYREIENRFGKNKANIARRLLNKSQTPPPPNVNIPPEVQRIIQQNFTEMNVNQQLALGNNMARARSGNQNAKRRVNAVGNTARFQSSVAAAMVTPFAKVILRNIAGTMSKPFVNKVAKMSKNQLVTTIQKIPVTDLAAIGERTATVTRRNSKSSRNMIRSALNLKRKLQSGNIMSLTNSQVSLLLQGISRAQRARNLFLRG